MIRPRVAKQPQRKKKNDKIFTVPASNTVTRRNGPNSIQVALSRTPLLPAFCKVQKMLYYDVGKSITINNSGLASQYFFSANGIYDPDISGTGHQPIGFDQLMTFYEQFTVVSATISCHYRGLSGAMFSISLAPGTTALTNPSQIVENGLLVMDSCSGFNTEVGMQHRKLSLDCDVKGYFGQMTEREMLNDNSLYGTNAANPTEQVYFAVSTWPNVGVPGSNMSLEFDVLISYDAIFWEPRKVTESLSAPLARQNLLKQVAKMEAKAQR